MQTIFDINNVIGSKIFWINKLKDENMDDFIKLLEVFGNVEYIIKYENILDIYDDTIDMRTSWELEKSEVGYYKDIQSLLIELICHGIDMKELLK